ncbi:DNA-deoxyinosine glycosylase [Limnohabitans sp.]|uniref:DNA-deoxyinosine glycosylase n=1 Tax=Limnohabitans sp. TaxID=1907725 RepID=UPI00286EC8BB|nr:DNA-deoxyinosine glycosylase [Limnohabitans sp.]
MSAIPTQAKPVLQGLSPLLDANTRLVVLGSFPGVASLRAQQYYGHPQNQFWKIMATLLSPNAAEVLAMPYTERAQWLLSHGVGLWDVYAACERVGSLDAHIQNAQSNDLQSLREHCPDLVAIAHNGGESFKHAKLTRALGLSVYRLPSTSPAHASWTFARKCEAWREVFQAAGLLS